MSNRVMSVTWRIDPRELGRRIEREYADELVRRAGKVMRDAAPEAEAHMKATAPWTDRTGEARRLLMAETTEGDGSITLYLIHGAAYGVHLELRHAGRYAVIVPATHEFAARIRRRMQGIMA